MNRLLLLSIACLSMLTAPAKAEYMDSMINYYKYYYRVITSPTAERTIGSSTYQVAASININYANSVYFFQEEKAALEDQNLFICYYLYYDAQSWLAYYRGDTSLANYYSSIEDYYISLREQSRYIAYNYSVIASDYLYLFETQVNAYADYQRYLIEFYKSYYRAITSPTVERTIGNWTYQVAVGININCANSVYFAQEANAAEEEQNLYRCYGYYYYVQSCLAFYSGDIPLRDYFEDLGYYYMNLVRTQSDYWFAYYHSDSGLAKYYQELYKAELAARTAW